MRLTDVLPAGGPGCAGATIDRDGLNQLPGCARTRLLGGQRRSHSQVRAAASRPTACWRRCRTFAPGVGRAP